MLTGSLQVAVLDFATNGSKPLINFSLKHVVKQLSITSVSYWK